ncbi:methyltransferase type 11 [Aliidongia dinghuensis]|uniref:Methyltransferase type 11 n=1 Tax=Aliidongia dinghuensis TaxID=1867774 RepID=A0A8J2YYB4_9PROT|nr:methyltransferase domain-containing protein [Aliidongia dinghuensis]GGF40136.1 methyltransferase type 11 [Aliidongia dinghuensis]
MYSDVVDLRDFYQSSLGQVARRMIRRRIRMIWPDVTGMRVLGLGYATPYLRPFHDEAERVAALMPAAQGVLQWPRGEKNVTALCDEGELPLQDASIDRILLIHALECSEELRPMLAEVWRVLAGGGRVLIVVPNRRGIWARLDRTPFGAGHPFTQAQLSRLLREMAFTPVQSSAALYIPPSASRMVLSAAGAWENIGERWFTSFAGVAMVEATKQIYAKSKPDTRQRRHLVYKPAATSI